jgi:hypothetical protein
MLLLFSIKLVKILKFWLMTKARSTLICRSNGKAATSLCLKKENSRYMWPTWVESRNPSGRWCWTSGFQAMRKQIHNFHYFCLHVFNLLRYCCYCWFVFLMGGKNEPFSVFHLYVFLYLNFEHPKLNFWICPCMLHTPRNKKREHERRPKAATRRSTAAVPHHH